MPAREDFLEGAAGMTAFSLAQAGDGGRLVGVTIGGAAPEAPDDPGFDGSLVPLRPATNGRKPLPFPENGIKPVSLRATFAANFTYRSDAEYDAIKAGLLEIERRLAELGGKDVRAEFQS